VTSFKTAQIRPQRGRSSAAGFRGRRLAIQRSSLASFGAGLVQQLPPVPPNSFQKTCLARLLAGSMDSACSAQLTNHCERQSFPPRQLHPRRGHGHANRHFIRPVVKATFSAKR